MSGKQQKRIRAKVGELLVEWLKGLVNEEEAEKITIDNYESMLPIQTHVYLQSGFKLNAFHPKWVAKRIKRILKRTPSKQLSEITLNDIEVS